MTERQRDANRVSSDNVLYAAPLRVDLEDERAWLGDNPLALSQKPFALLTTLMQSAEKLVSKDTLIETVWDGRAVSDAVLTTAIRELRQALGDNARAPEFIETAHGRGYRFLKAVTTVAPLSTDQPPIDNTDVELTPTVSNPSDAAPTKPQQSSRPRLILLMLALGAAILIVGSIVVSRNAAPIDREDGRSAPASVAVLAFEDLSTNSDQSYFSDGISEEILNSLVKLDGMMVAGRTSSFSFKGKQVDLQTIGEALNVDHILEGSVRTSGNRVRVTAQLIKVSDGFHIWSEVYEREVEDIFTIQDEIARSVARELEILLVEDHHQPIVTASTEDPEAYRLYLQGKALLARRVENNLPRSIDLFHQATARDPQFARAWSAMATAYALQPDYNYDIVLGDAAASATDAANRAIELDPSLAEPHAVLGLIAFDRRDYVAARQSFDRASDLDPRDVGVMFWKSTLLRSVGDLPAAATLSEQAVRADPISPLGYVSQATFEFATGNLDAATALAERARDLGHPTGNYILAKIAEQTGNRDRARALHYESFVQSGVSTWFSEAQIDTLLRGTYGSEAERTAAREVIAQYESAGDMKRDILAPNILFDMGYPQEALTLFEQSRTSLDQFFLLPIWSPAGNKVRQAPSFDTFAEHIGLKAYWAVYGLPNSCAWASDSRVTCR